MKKKTIICICVSIIVVGIFTRTVIYLYNKSKTKLDIKDEITQKGYEILGNDYCTTDHLFEIAGDALTEWKCQLCGTSETNSDTNVPILCGNCARKTNRCYQCGKLKK